MHFVAGIIGGALIVFLLIDVFRVLVLARRATGKFRLTYIIYRATWPIFARVGRNIQSGRTREDFLGIYGPLSLLLIFTVWACGLILSFGAVRWATHVNAVAPHLADDVYQSAAAFLTMGGGNTGHGLSRWITVLEAGIGLSFLGLVVGYLPVFYQSFSRRELHISLLDARGGSPPSAAELILRQARYPQQLERQLASWEIWAADLLQDELSYPMLAYFRSQHINQSWLGALVAIADTSALIMLSAHDELQTQANATFAMARHTLIDSVKTLGIAPEHGDVRLSTVDLKNIRRVVIETGDTLDHKLLSDDRVNRLLASYEPYAVSLAVHLLMSLPPWIPDKTVTDNWRMTSRRPSGSQFAVSDPFRENDDQAEDRSA